jgi:D-methionine transport system substrate-binding protein
MNPPFILATLLALAAISTASCGKRSSANHLKVGVISGTEEQVAEVAQRIAKEKFGLVVELVAFNDYVTPNAALADGSSSAFQNPFCRPCTPASQSR